MHVSSILVTHVVLVLMVLPKFLSLNPFWRAGLALVLECYEKFYKVHSIEVLSPDLVNKNNSSSLIITNMELRFELCVFNLIWK
jgi:hypothetical protein